MREKARDDAVSRPSRECVCRRLMLKYVHINVASLLVDGLARGVALGGRTIFVKCPGVPMAALANCMTRYSCVASYAV